jgi:hypothetical protein
MLTPNLSSRTGNENALSLFLMKKSNNSTFSSLAIESNVLLDIVIIKPPNVLGVL